MNSLDLALIGNCSIGALVGPTAEVVWACFPRFDGDAMFCSLLRERERERDGAADFGFMAVDLIDFSHAEQEYLTNTAILVTRLYDRHGGAVEVTDFAPRFRQHGRMFAPMTLVRQLKRLAGSPRAVLRIRPAHDPERVGLFGHDLGERELEVLDAVPRDRRDAVHRRLGDVGSLLQSRPGRRRQVGLVEDHEQRDVFGADEREDLQLAGAEPELRLGDEQGHVGLVQHVARPPDAQLAQRALVVEAGRVDDGDGPQGQQLHGLVDRVGRGALHLRNDGDLLAGQGVDEAGLADVAPAEERDVYALALGCLVEAHNVSTGLTTPSGPLFSTCV